MPFEEHHEDAEDANVALMKQRLSGFETEEGRLQGLSYVPLRQDEVVVTTTPKAGTTWTQQVRTFSCLVVCEIGIIPCSTAILSSEKNAICFILLCLISITLDLPSTSFCT
jgi:hypothetical protein